MGLSSSDSKESESQQRDIPFDLPAIQAAVDQAVLLRATASQAALTQAAADREIADNAVREMDTARRKAADQALTYNAQVCLKPFIVHSILLPSPSLFSPLPVQSFYFSPSILHCTLPALT
jgi:hypothetical protein